MFQNSAMHCSLSMTRGLATSMPSITLSESCCSFTLLSSRTNACLLRRCFWNDRKFLHCLAQPPIRQVIFKSGSKEWTEPTCLMTPCTLVAAKLWQMVQVNFIVRLSVCRWREEDDILSNKDYLSNANQQRETGEYARWYTTPIIRVFNTFHFAHDTPGAASEYCQPIAVDSQAVHDVQSRSAWLPGNKKRIAIVEKWTENELDYLKEEFLKSFSLQNTVKPHQITF